jgi:hypothetical protein
MEIDYSKLQTEEMCKLVIQEYGWNNIDYFKIEKQKKRIEKEKKMKIFFFSFFSNTFWTFFFPPPPKIMGTKC